MGIEMKGIEISSDIDNVKIQIEYSLAYYTHGSNADIQKEYIMLRTFENLLKALSPEKKAEIKEEFEADEVNVTNIVVISEVNGQEVMTHLNHEIMVTTVQPK
jgi:hypothetical protein